jgi:hypothetical protein
LVLAGGAWEIVQHAGGPAGPAPSGNGRANAPASGFGSAGISAGAPLAGPQVAYQHAGRPDTVTAVISSTDFTPANLSSEVSSALAQPAGSRTAGPSAVRDNPEASAGLGNASAPALQGCVNRIAAGQQVLLVDIARYLGKPATVIVTRAAPAAPEQIWVVGAGCSPARSDVLAHVALASR